MAAPTPIDPSDRSGEFEPGIDQVEQAFNLLSQAKQLLDSVPEGTTAKDLLRNENLINNISGGHADNLDLYDTQDFVSYAHQFLGYVVDELYAEDEDRTTTSNPQPSQRKSPLTRGGFQKL